MLASTMQFSSYERNPPPNPAPTPTHPTPTHTHRHPRHPQTSTDPSDEHEAVHRGSGPQEHEPSQAGARSLRTQQRAKPTHHTRNAFQPLTRRPGSTHTRRGSTGQLVDVPPM